MSVLIKVVHTLYYMCLLLFYVLLYCISVLHMTKPAVSRMHYNCYTYQQINAASCLWSLTWYEHTWQSVSYKRLKLGPLLKPFHWPTEGVQSRCLLILEPTCALYPEGDNQNCHWEQETFKLVQCNVQNFDCRGRKKKLLMRRFLYHSGHEWFIIVIHCMAGFWATCLCWKDWNPEYIFAYLFTCSVTLLSFFCLSAFTSCLVCESTGLHLILVLTVMFGAAPGGLNNTCYVLFRKIMKDNVSNISPWFLTH